ncbi:hypothetical protein CROQUDRAFT_51545, partial [Cronartium quercuum f. sp. fusiforme G11]
MDIDRFIKDFESYAHSDGASDRDKCHQVVFFMPEAEVRTTVEAMDGYLQRKWMLLRREMKELWGAGLEPLYTINGLVQLCKELKKVGGISKKVDYSRFQQKFKTQISYLRKTGQLDKGDSKII